MLLIGKLRDGTNKVLFDEENFTPDSRNKSIVSSKRRPFDCTAILNIVIFLIYFFDCNKIGLPNGKPISLLVIYTHKSAAYLVYELR